MIMSSLPLWVPYALGASLFGAAGLYMHQRFGGTNTASAVWMKILAVMIAVPVLFVSGLPTAPEFYILTAIAAAIWCINDLIFFDATKNHGAALVARLSPLGVITSFVAWFAIRPELLDEYMQNMPRFIAICAVITICCMCAAWLRHCPVSWRALKSIWFVIVGSTIGFILIKIATDYAPQTQGVFGYIGIEAAIMLAFYAIYFTIRTPGAWGEVFSRAGIRTGFTVGLLLTISVICRVFAFKDVDHPAFVSMLCMMDVVWLMILAKLSGWKDESNKIAGFGIVACVVALTFLRLN